MSNFQEYVHKHPKSNPQPINYGTSGLRYKAQFLDSIAFRMGIVATLRSRDTGGKVIGLMITASHNPVEDNGIKLIDYTGDMIEEGWENICSMLANVADEILEETVQQVIQERVSDKTGKIRGLVVVGRDTRPSSESLSKAAIDGLRAMNALTTNDFCSENLGLLTTPQLHYIVHAFNHAHQGEPNERGYYDKFGAAFIDLMDSLEHAKNSNKYQPEVHLDCANGVGGPKMEIFAPQISTHLKIVLHNKGEGVVNQDCGSSFVETTFREPFECQVKPGEKWASFDGDADRIIYYYKDPASNAIRLLNGDKLAALFSLYVRELLEASSLVSKLKFGVVQTAYSNGRTTQFIRNLLQIEPDCAATGVKNLMIKTKKYDIAVFFEANGHGSIVYTEKAKSVLLAEEERDNKAATMLLKVLNLMNQGTGDAISDLLLTEAILKAKGWNLADWDAIYETSPSCLLKIVVPDRHFVKSNEIATLVLEPKGLQTEIDKLIKSLTNEGRVVVRPSGTEDIVRVYAEAESQEKADKLANEVLQLVKKYSER